MQASEFTITKRTLLKSLKDLPEAFTIDDLMERLTVLQKIERGLEEMRAGKGVPTATARKRLAKWLK